MNQFSLVDLSEYAAVFNGKTPANADKRASGKPVLKIKDVSEDGRFRGYFDSFVDSAFVEKHETKRVQQGDILILNAAHNADYVGSKIYRAEQGVWGALATGEWLIIRPKSDVLDPAYAYYWVVNGRTKHAIRQLVKGIHLYPKDVARLRIPLPPLSEQRRIAAILDKADEVRRKRQEAIRLTEELLRSAFLDMFGDPVTNPKGWPTELFGEVGKLDRGRSRHRPRNAPELLGGPYPLIQTGDVANAKGYIRSYTQTYSELGLAQSKMWPAGTLCITIAANIAKTAILAIDACFPDSVVGFKPNGKVRTEYIQFWLSFLQKILEESAPESAQKNINLAILRSLKVPVPPISLQDSFVLLVQKIEAHKEKMEESTRKYNDLFNSLVQRAFKGEL